MSEDKWIHRFSVDETYKHKNGYTLYKITSVLFPLTSPEAVTVVSVWKRYRQLRRLHQDLKTLCRSMHLPTLPDLPTHGYFNRFNQEVIEERCRSVKVMLEFVAEHRLLVTSAEFVNFLQSGHPSPENEGGVIREIREQLQLPLDDAPLIPAVYSDDEETSHTTSCNNNSSQPDNANRGPLNISDIKIFEGVDIEVRKSPKKLSISDSIDSIESLGSIDSDLFDELSKISIDKPRSSVKRKTVLPDLINFDEPSTSSFQDDHTDVISNSERENSVFESNSSISEPRRSDSRVSSQTVRSLSLTHTNVDCATKTEDSYVFEAGYMLNLAARCEEAEDYARAFEYYKSGIEKMLIGVQSDPDPQRRALIKQKTNKYLSYAEHIYTNHLNEQMQPLPLQTRAECSPVPLAMLRRAPAQLARYRVLAVLGAAMMLALDRQAQRCYTIKVIQKIPNNLTEIDEYIPRRSDTKQVILPTCIPYMVPLHAYVETNDLIFLILGYAPGEKLMAYIRQYVNSVPSTPAREVNLENVFAEPHKPRKTDDDDDDDAVKVMVKNSQRLLKDVDLALNQSKKDEGGCALDGVVKENSSRTVLSASSVRAAIPSGARAAWAAQLLLCIEHLHGAGVVCRDLNPNNILLGEKGQLIVTYIVGYEGLDMTLAAIDKCAKHEVNMYIAPELYNNVYMDTDRRGYIEAVCDFWSYGAVLYELICGVPLSHYHNTVFTSHTILQMPDELSLEAHSLLTQLLTYDPSERLGSGPNGIKDIKSHPYFKTINWQDVLDDWTMPD